MKLWYEVIGTKWLWYETSVFAVPTNEYSVSPVWTQYVSGNNEYPPLKKSNSQAFYFHHIYSLMHPSVMKL